MFLSTTLILVHHEFVTKNIHHLEMCKILSYPFLVNIWAITVYLTMAKYQN